jgi:phage shock protein E
MAPPWIEYLRKYATTVYDPFHTHPTTPPAPARDAGRRPQEPTRMRRLPTRAVLLALLTLVLVVVAACGSSTAAVQKVSAADAVGMLDSRTVIDVRTPAEFAQGHVAGAVNIDVEAPDFATQIKALDPKAPYLVYCRSGRRSAIAADEMAKAGFTSIVDGGGLADLVAAGAPTE